MGSISEDCVQLNSFLGRDQSTICCGVSKNISCDADGYITTLKLDKSDILVESSFISDTSNFMRFPIFSKLIKLSIGVPNLNENVLPSRFFDQPMLDILEVYESNISSIPNNINKDCPVTEINLEHNEITEFPYQFSDLPRLQHIYLWDNKISGTINLEKFKTLNQIDVATNQVNDIINIPSGLQVLFASENPIKKIPDEVPNLVDLNVLVFNSTGITELPPNLFKLKNLKRFHISNNPQLSTKIINFDNQNIKECSFEGTNVICYQPNTCVGINANSYSPCSSSDINEIKSKQTVINSENKESGFLKFLKSKSVIIGGIAIVIILALLGFIIIRKKKNNKNDLYDDDKNYDIVVTEKIKKVKIFEDVSYEGKKEEDGKKGNKNDDDVNKINNKNDEVNKINNENDVNKINNKIKPRRFSSYKDHSVINATPIPGYEQESQISMDINDAYNYNNRNQLGYVNNENENMNNYTTGSTSSNINDEYGTLPSYENISNNLHSTIPISDEKRPLN
jgi:Leucine-rich repeat (LRR) protein